MFLQDLIGLKAIDGTTGRAYGVLQEVLPTGANDVYRIVDGAGKEYLFPAVKQMSSGNQPGGGRHPAAAHPRHLRPGRGGSRDCGWISSPCSRRCSPRCWGTASSAGPGRRGCCRCAATSCGTFPPTPGAVWMTRCSAAGKGMLLAAEPFCPGHRPAAGTFGLAAAYSVYVPPWEGPHPGGRQAPGPRAGAGAPLRPLRGRGPAPAGRVPGG